MSCLEVDTRNKKDTSSSPGQNHKIQEKERVLHLSGLPELEVFSLKFQLIGRSRKKRGHGKKR